MPTALKSTMTFSDEQAMLLDTATDFCRDKFPTARVRELIGTETGFDATTWRELVDLGWTGIALPEAYGGSGLGLAAAVPVVEPLGRYLAATPLLATQLCGAGIVAGAGEELKTEVLPRLAAGAIGTVALFEEDGNWDLTAAAASLAVAGDRVAVTGTKTLVPDARAADVLLVSGNLDGAPALLLVEKKQLDATAVTRETVIDETRRSYRVTLDGVEAPLSSLIRGDAALKALAAIRDAALLLVSAEAAGGLAGTLELIVEYLNTRTAFGRKIGGFQALKHPTVDILVGLERSRSHLYHAASLLDAGEDALVALRMAKAEVSESFAFAGDRAIQFHGGLGFTYECDAQLFLRRALWCQYAYGDAAHHRRHLAEALL